MVSQISLLFIMCTLCVLTVLATLYWPPPPDTHGGTFPRRCAVQVRPLATHAASHALAHARTWPAWDVQHTPAKPPRPNISTSFCTQHLSAQHHTTAHSSFSGQQQPTTHTDNTLHASTRLITHTRTLTRSSAAPQIQQQQQPSQQSMQHAAVQASFWH